MKLEEAKMIFSKYFKDSPGKDFVMAVMDSIEIEKELKPRERAEKEKAAKKQKEETPEYAQKPKKKKVCESCGKEFYPNSGVQKLCLECRRQKADISNTAREMLNL